MDILITMNSDVTEILKIHGHHIVLGQYETNIQNTPTWYNICMERMKQMFMYI